jgi:hypothetical protein
VKGKEDRDSEGREGRADKEERESAGGNMAETWERAPFYY